MIFTFLLNIGYSFITTILGLLPASTGLPTGIHDALVYAIGAVNSLSYLIPPGALLGALVVVIGYEAGMWAFHAGQWLWKRLPFVGK